MTINLDRSLADALNQSMKLSETVELPFPVVYLWALNGQASYKSQGNALYFGGWACKSEDAEPVAEQQGLDLPDTWAKATIATRDGGEFDAYVTRHVVVAPIGKRVSWLDREGRRHASYLEGGRRHIQVLCYLADVVTEGKQKHYVPWGPVVITAKGYQAKNLLDALSTWDKASAPFRRKVAPGVPAWCFYLALGTFAKEREVLNVGKPGAQSPITPIVAYIPPDLSEKHLEHLFVSNEIATVMVDLAEQAKEWLEAWKQGENGEAGVVEPGAEAFAPANFDDLDVPF